MEENKYGRLKKPYTEIECKELNWWKRNAEIEDKFCWVQPVRYQKLLRNDYVSYLRKNINEENNILELGCGTGWLLFLLHNAGFKKLRGIDFSNEQINIALEKKEKLTAKKNAQLDFSVGGFDMLANENVKYDIIICHGFLHHLAEEEIKFILDNIYKYITEDGKLLIWEPFIYTRNPDVISSRFDKIKRLFIKGKRYGRVFSKDEIHYRRLIKNRNEGTGLRGPSPKEIPFQKEEFLDLLGSKWTIFSQKKFMAFSHLIGQELLLTGLTYPVLVRIIELPILFVTKFFERRLINRKIINSPFWIFELIECKPKQKHV